MEDPRFSNRPVNPLDERKFQGSKKTFLGSIFGRMALILYNGTTDKAALSEADGKLMVSGYGKAGSTSTAIAVETTGEQKVVGYGKDSGGNIDPLRTNANQQLQVEVIGGTRKVLGSSAPAATTETVLYTVPASKSTYIHSLWICNRGAIESCRIGISVGGGALANEDYVMYDVVVPGADALFYASEKMWCLAATDEVRVRSSAGNLTYKIFGEETDA